MRFVALSCAVKFHLLFACTLLLAFATACPSNDNTTDASIAADAAVANDAATQPDAAEQIDATTFEDAAVAMDAAEMDAAAPDAAPMDAAASIQKANCDPATQIDSAIGAANYPRISSNRSGVIAVAWQEQDVPQGVPRGVARIYSGGAFGALHTLSESVSRTAATAVDGLGNVHADWSESLGTSRVRADYDATMMTWGASDPWETTPSTDIDGPLELLVANASGLALHAMWFRANQMNTVAALFFDPIGKMWSMQETLEAQSMIGAPDLPLVAVNDAGQGAVVWALTDGATGIALHASAYANGVFAPWIGVDIPCCAGHVGVGALANGDIIVVYAGLSQMLARRFSPSAAAGMEWSAEEILLDAQPPGRPIVLVDEDDNVTAVFPSQGTVYAARRLNGAWTEAQNLGTTNEDPSAALDSAGNVTVEYRGDNQPVRIRRVEKTGTMWTDPVDVTANEEGFFFAARVAHDEHDNPVLVYQRTLSTPQGNENHIRAIVCR